MKKSVVSALLLAMFASAAVHAGSSIPAAVTTGGNSKTDTKAYAGLNWTLGGGPVPSVVLGVFNTKVKANGDTTGANLAFHLNVAGGIKPGKLKLSYLNGQEDLQGEIGVGYDFVKAEPLVGLGLNAPHVAIGVDGYLNPGFVPYLTIHSQGEFDKPGKTTKYYCGNTEVDQTESCNNPG